jgi:DNA-directed RNA polymerase beta' subunit
LVEGKAIRIHPLVCTAFNADFDGDQMAVHIPLSFEAQLEARVLMLSSNNILLPANGKPVAAPTQDIIMGCYFLTKEKPADPEGGEIRSFISEEEVLLAHHNGLVGLHAPVRLRRDGGMITTTPGRIIFNQVVPDEMGFVNERMTKSTLEDLVFQVYRRAGIERAVRFLDDLKDLGFDYATRAGASVGVEDFIIPGEKKKILEETNKEVNRIIKAYRDKVITDGERYNRVIDTWQHTSSHIARQTFEELKESQGGFNPLWMMIDSGARGSRDQIRQLAGMRGLMAKPQKKITGQVGEIIESPIKSNFREGLSVLEYFISTHGARKGLADTALKTADAGYLTRRLVDVTQDVTITIDDCQTVRGLDVSALKEGEDVIEPLKDRIVGSVALDDVLDPITGDVIVEAGEEITLDAATRAEESGVEKVKIRSVLTCEARRGLCRKCYGRNLATMNPIDIGEAVGIIAAQSIGEPGTQLTLRTFHIGGTAGRIAVQTEKAAPSTGEVDLNNVQYVTKEVSLDRGDGRRIKRVTRIVTGKEGELLLTDMIVPGEQGEHFTKKKEQRQRKLMVPYGAELDACLFESRAVKGGTVKFVDIIEGETVKEVEVAGRGAADRILAVVRKPGEPGESGKHAGKPLFPRIRIVDAKGRKISEHPVPFGAHLIVSEGAKVKAGTLLYWVGRDRTVLFRWDPYSTPILTDKGGTVHFVDIVEEVTMREEPDKLEGHKVKVIIEDRDKAFHPHIQIMDAKGKKIRDYAVPTGAQLLVSDGQTVEAGDILVKLSREMYKTRDITGGLPRVAELFEARRPKDPAVITEIDGRVKFGDIVRGNRQMIVEPEKGEPREYLVPHGKHLLVHEGDIVRAGDRLSEGPINPHDILKIKGPNAVQEYLLNEVQEVYRLQGVKIHDKHIGVIVRQMLQKVRITDPGDTLFLEDEHVDKITFQEENEKTTRNGGEPAKAEPLLLGITKASLTTDSFISAASFQETTRVLTEAAVRGVRDDLLGLKENIIIGHLIPAGTGSLNIQSLRFPNAVEERVEEAVIRTDDAPPGDDDGDGADESVESKEVAV